MIGARREIRASPAAASPPPTAALTPLSAQVNRPLSMKKDGIQTRKRKPKSMGGAHGGVPRAQPPLSGTC